MKLSIASHLFYENYIYRLFNRSIYYLPITYYPVNRIYQQKHMVNKIYLNNNMFQLGKFAVLLHYLN
jgi:hypothetical protein